ncbi:hypothetical protein M3Y94_01233100 [Aphelenchoides besseyi]|nr:hypothetical protein M3Y94_01233100 [Aphelenchoides besseyi]KAI6217551.1 hypothetical protein M3Y95_01215600 [Aphelenchoides besseyi]
MTRGWFRVSDWRRRTKSNPEEGLVPTDARAICPIDQFETPTKSTTYSDNMTACDNTQSLHQELRLLKTELAERNRQCAELLKTQRITDSHIADLTEQLFSEAYRQVNEQKALTRSAEMRVAEKQMIVDLLMVEVAALKAELVELKLELKNKNI